MSEDKDDEPRVVEERKIIQWSLWTQNFSRGDKTNCFTHESDLFFRQKIANARDGTLTQLETALHPIKMGELGLENLFYNKKNQRNCNNHIIELEIERKCFKNRNRRRGRNQNGNSKRELLVEAKSRIKELLQRATRSRSFGFDDQTK